MIGFPPRYSGRVEIEAGLRNEFAAAGRAGGEVCLFGDLGVALLAEPICLSVCFHLHPVRVSSPAKVKLRSVYLTSG